MVSLVLHSINLVSLDSQKRLTQQSLHPSAASNYFNFSAFIQNPLLNEYLIILTHTIVFGTLLYFILSCSSYTFLYIFNKEKYIPTLRTSDFKILHDIKWSLLNIWGEAFLVSMLRMAIPRYSFIYYDLAEYPLWVVPITICLHVIWDETLTYWAHRFLHTYKWLYLKLHIVHHRSISITPFAGFAFHPIDAFLQALPTFTSSFFFPLHYNIFLLFSVATTCWAISIHDNVPAMPCKLFLYATHHTIHHEKGQGGHRNYGKFTTIWDRMMGSYEDPDRINFGWKHQSREAFFAPFNNFLARTFNNLLAPKRD